MLNIAKLQAFNLKKTGLFLRSNIASVYRFYLCSTQNKQDRNNHYLERRVE